MWPKDVEPGLNFYRQVALRRHQVSSGSELMLWRLLARCAESADSPDFPDFPESAQGKDSSETRGPIALYTVDKSQANGTLGMSIAGGCVGRKGGHCASFFRRLKPSSWHYAAQTRTSAVSLLPKYIPTAPSLAFRASGLVTGCEPSLLLSSQPQPF